jgi:2-oxoglutarate ferredoxin oxidoreductase subunit beta
VTERAKADVRWILPLKGRSASVLARGAVHTPAAIAWTKRILREAFEVQVVGRRFSFVEVLTMCPTDWYVEPSETPEWVEKNFTGTYPLKILKQPA